MVWSLVPEDIDFRLKLEGLGGHATLVRASDTVRADVPVFPPPQGGVFTELDVELTGVDVAGEALSGVLSIQAGAYALQKANGGSGKLLGGVPGVKPAKVLAVARTGVDGSRPVRAASAGSNQFSTSATVRSGEIVDGMSMISTSTPW